MTTGRCWGPRRELLSRALAWGLGLGITGLACANPDTTSAVLTTAGAAAVIVGASMASDGQCYRSNDGDGREYCSPGLSKGARQAGTALAIAGVGAAAAGYAMQPKGPDQLAPAPAPRATNGRYRLLRRAPAASTEAVNAEVPKEEAGTAPAPVVTPATVPAAASETPQAPATPEAPEPPQVEAPAAP